VALGAQEASTVRFLIHPSAWKVYSRKFVCRILHSRGPKVGCRAYHQMVKHTSQHYILWCWIKIRWGEWSNAFIVGSSAVAMVLDRDPKSYGHRLWKIASTTLSRSHLAKIGRGGSGCGTGRSSGKDRVAVARTPQCPSNTRGACYSGVLLQHATPDCASRRTTSPCLALRAHAP
jgi:hypothetical protein